MKKFLSALPALVFIGFVGVFSLAFFRPDREFSPRENRPLAGPPRFSAEGFFMPGWSAEQKENGFTKRFENYLTDQFFLRDNWITLKSLTELAAGKGDASGVYVGAEGLLVSRQERPPAGRVERNALSVEKLALEAGIPVYFTLVPGQADIWADRLPANAKNYSGRAVVEEALALVKSARYVDTFAALEARRSEDIFFATDHHWSALGAHCGYAALVREMGLEPAALGAPFEAIPGFYGTASSACGLFPGAGDTVLLYERCEGVRVTAFDGGEKEISVYDMAAAEGKDKYAVFFGGNYPRMVLQGTDEALPRLLLLKDSYANAELPFLAGHFSEIHVIDLRYFTGSVYKYIEENGIDAAAVSYSIGNFSTDDNLKKLYIK